MSTKCSIAYGENKFHFYHECFDDENVYLELEGENLEYEASPGRVMVKIPNEIMAVLQVAFKHDVSLAALTEEQVIADCEKYVDERIERVRKTKAEGRNPGLMSLLGAIPYGSAEDPREKQVSQGVAYMMAKRAKQLEELAEIKKFTEVDDGSKT